MEFKAFLGLVSKVRNLPLPGRDVQLEMAPMERLKSLRDADVEARNPRQAGVMAVFYPDGRQQTQFVLILRKVYKGVHSNQVGFPGGKEEEEDRSIAHTALRETEEEVGIPMKDITVIRKMTNIYIPPSNFWVQCFMGYLEALPTLIAQESEVESIIQVSLSEFLSDDALITKKLSTSYMESVEVPAFHLEGHVVWGATAMMLNEVRSLLIASMQA